MLYAAKNESAPELSISIERDNAQILQSYLSLLKENSVFANETLAKEWNYKKNGFLNPQYMSQNSNHKVWWKCKKGHEWQAAINSRTAGNGCPYCSNKKVFFSCCIKEGGVRRARPEPAEAKNHPVNGFSAPRAGAGTAPVPGANPSFSAIYVHNSNVVHVVFLENMRRFPSLHLRGY